jgi:hypothetical protein
MWRAREPEMRSKAIAKRDKNQRSPRPGPFDKLVPEKHLSAAAIDGIVKLAGWA